MLRSLVGSEMCIRDRIRIPQNTRAPGSPVPSLSLILNITVILTLTVTLLNPTNPTCKSKMMKLAFFRQISPQHHHSNAMLLNTLYICEYTGHHAALGVTDFPSSIMLPTCGLPDMHSMSSSRHVGTAVVFIRRYTHTQTFYGPFSMTTQVSRCQKRTSGLYGARED